VLISSIIYELLTAPRENVYQYIIIIIIINITTNTDTDIYNQRQL